jgi:hypothetical protein
MSWYCVSSLLSYDFILTCLWHYRRDSYQLIASTANEHLSIVVLDFRLHLDQQSSKAFHLIFASCDWQKNFMSQSQSRENVFSERSNLIFETIILARQLKVLLNTSLHRRRVKSTFREILEIVCRLYSDITSKSAFEKTKDKIRASKEFDHSQKQFSFDWVMNFTLITTTVKTVFVEIRHFRNYLAENFEFAFSIQIFSSSIDDSVDLNTLSVSLKHSFTERKRKSDEIETLKKRSDSNESREISATNSAENSEFDDIEFNSSQTSLHSQSTEVDIFESLTYSNQVNSVKKNRSLQKFDTSLNRSRSTQTSNQISSKRVYSTTDSARVHSKENLFQSSHLSNLKQFFIIQRSLSFTFISESAKASTISNKETILSKKYFENAFSIVFRQFNYQFFARICSTQHQSELSRIDSLKHRQISLSNDHEVRCWVIEKYAKSIVTRVRKREFFKFWAE